MKRITFFDVSDEHGDELDVALDAFGDGDAMISVDSRPSEAHPAGGSAIVYLNAEQVEKLRDVLDAYIATRTPAPRKLWDEA